MVREHYGFVPNFFKSQGDHPDAIQAEAAMAGSILRNRALHLALKEQIGLVVSGINSSSYCVAADMQMLHRLGVEDSLSSKLVTDYPSAPVREKVQALFRFADKLTRNGVEIEKPDVDALFKAGWDEAALVEAVLTVAWFNFTNRLPFGVGLVADF